MSPTELLVQRLRQLIAQGAGRLPLPGTGSTLRRWQVLASISVEDVALVKLFEGHTDALAILAELGQEDGSPDVIWGTWAAEPVSARLTLSRADGGITLSGRKAWCSGAGAVTHALVTAWDRENRQCLAAVEMGQPGITVTDEGWHAIGMGRAPSPDVLFDAAAALEVGQADSYTSRLGFWHGSAGIAACWYGGALPLAEAVAQLAERRADPHVLAHLGAIDVALGATQALLRQAAAWIDENPTASAQPVAMRVRAAAEYAVGAVLDRAGRALGAGPLCRDEQLARRFADLPVFVRQSHAEQDLASLGSLILPSDAQSSTASWSL